MPTESYPGEFTSRANGLYAGLLGRPGDPEGLAFWADQYAQGKSDAEVRANFIQSARSVTGNPNIGRITPQPTSPSTNQAQPSTQQAPIPSATQRLTDLYASVGKAGGLSGGLVDPEGWNYWLGRLNAGEDISKAFTNSAQKVYSDTLAGKASPYTTQNMRGLRNLTDTGQVVAPGTPIPTQQNIQSGQQFGQQFRFMLPQQGDISARVNALLESLTGQGPRDNFGRLISAMPRSRAREGMSPGLIPPGRRPFPQQAMPQIPQRAQTQFPEQMPSPFPTPDAPMQIPPLSPVMQNQAGLTPPPLVSPSGNFTTSGAQAPGVPAPITPTVIPPESPAIQPPPVINQPAPVFQGTPTPIQPNLGPPTRITTPPPAITAGPGPAPPIYTPEWYEWMKIAPPEQVAAAAPSGWTGLYGNNNDY